MSAKFAQSVLVCAPRVPRRKFVYNGEVLQIDLILIEEND